MSVDGLCGVIPHTIHPLTYFIHLPMKMEPTVSSETSAIRTQTPGNCPKRNKLQFNSYLQTRCCGSISCCVGMCCGVVARCASYDASYDAHLATVPQHNKYELNCEYCNITLTRNKAPWWWLDKIEICWSVLKCFMWNYMCIPWLINWSDENEYTFLIVSRSCPLRTRNISDKTCTENQNTRYMFSNLFSTFVPFMR